MTSLPASIELVRPGLRRGGFRLAIFDFDGTVSLIREGWAGIMADLGLDLLREQDKLKEPAADLRIYLEDQMLRLSGKPSIYQMRRLAEVIGEQGGTPGDPEQYLQEFLARLFAITGQRKDDLVSGKAPPSAWAVAGTHALLDQLRSRGVHLVLASGTDLAHVRTEAELLGLTGYFAPHIYAPANDTPNFSKGEVMARMLTEFNVTPDQVISFGDGYSETVEIKRLGGVAVGVASREADLPGINEMKRTMLIELGADLILADYREHQALVPWLFDGASS